MEINRSTQARSGLGGQGLRPFEPIFLIKDTFKVSQALTKKV
jgi:hypothetical protein